MKPKAEAILAVIVLAFCSGCNSVVQHSARNSSEIYGGVHSDAHSIIHPDAWSDPIFCVVDLPFSFLADTLYLPSDLNNQKPSVDPLKGWISWNPSDEESHPSIPRINNPAQPAKHSPLDQSIKDDYQNYLQKHEPGYFSVEGATFYENGTGQHAVKVTIGRGGNYKVYIFIYDKPNMRTRIIKYPTGQYAC